MKYDYSECMDEACNVIGCDTCSSSELCEVCQEGYYVEN